MRKIILYTLIITGSFTSLQAQNVSINTSGADPDASSMLDVSSTNSGVLIPRMTAAQRLGISSPANGLMVFQTDGSIGFYIYLSGLATWTRVTTESNLDLPAVLALGKDASGDSILSLGALGIGTNSPASPLHVEASQTNNTFNGNGLYVVNSSVASGTQHAFITARTQNAGGSPYFALDIDGQAGYSIGLDQTNSTLDFYPNSDGTGAAIMSLNSTQLGIGTQIPLEDIHLSRTGSATLLITADTDNVTESDNPAIELRQDGGTVNGRWGFEGTAGSILTSTLENAMYLGTTSSYPLQLATNSNVRMTIENGGDVGVGTTNPTDKLEVFNAGNVRVRTNSSTNGFSGFVANNSLREYFMGIQGSGDAVPGEFHIYDNTSGAQRMVIDASGNMGISQSNPSGKLHITATDNSGDFYLDDTFPFIFLNTTSGGNAGFHFRSSGASEAELYYSAGSDVMIYNHLNSSGTDLTLNSSGFFGIQQGTPTVRLQVDGGSDAALTGGTGYIMTNAESTTNIIIDDNEIMARNNGAESPIYLQNDGGDFHIHNAQAGGTQFIVEDDGSVGIRTSAPSNDLHIEQSTATTAGTGGARFSTGGTFWKIFHSGIHFSFVDDGTRVAYVEGSTGNYVQPSDSSLKSNIQDMDNILGSVMKLRPVSYFYKGFGQNAVQTTGFLAQEVALEMPSLVRYGEDGQMGLSYSEFSVLAIKAIQEQQKIIEALEKRIEELEAQLNK